jgi:hypothetical protein
LKGIPLHVLLKLRIRCRRRDGVHFYWIFWTRNTFFLNFPELRNKLSNGYLNDSMVRAMDI